MQCPNPGARADGTHEPLGELVSYGQTEHEDEVNASVEVIEEDGSPQPNVLEGRLCVCKHCHLVYWEPS